MTTTKVIASLSQDGWVFDSQKRLDYIVSYYILTDNIQSLVFKGNLISLPFTYYNNISDPEAMKVAIKQDLDKLLGRYFQSVDIATTVRKINDTTYGIAIYAAVIDDEGIKYEISKALSINNSLSSKVVTLNNYGSALDYINNLTT